MYDESENGNGMEQEMRVPPTPKSQFVRVMTEQEMEAVNSIIRQAEGLTEKMMHDWRVRQSLRDAIADMACPWKVRDVLVLNDGRGPVDRRVVVGVVGGETEKGEFFRVLTKVLKKGSTPGKRVMRLKIVEGLVVNVMGVFEGALGEVEVVDGKMEV